MSIGVIKFGIDIEIEGRATVLLMRDRKQRGLKANRVVTTDEYSWLNDWQLEDRLSREVYTSIGYPDPNIIEGRVFRAFNPHFGKRPSRLQAADW